MENERNGDTTYNTCNRNGPDERGEETGGVRNQRMSHDHAKNCIIEVYQHTEKSPGDLRRLSVVQTPVKTISKCWCENFTTNNNNNNNRHNILPINNMTNRNVIQRRTKTIVLGVIIGRCSPDSKHGGLAVSCECWLFFFQVYKIKQCLKSKTSTQKNGLEKTTNSHFIAILGATIRYRDILFTNPSARAGYDTKSIFKRSLTGFNSEFSFS